MLEATSQDGPFYGWVATPLESGHADCSKGNRTTVRYGDSHEQKCRYFLSHFPCQVMSWDARKPNIRSQTKCTLYTFFSKNRWVTIETSLCFELEQIRDHFYYTNFLFFYNKSGLRFAVTQSIMTLGLRTCNRFFQKTAGLL